MSEVLVLVEQVDGEVKKVTNELLTAARRLGEPSAVVVGAPGTAAKVRDALAGYGAAKVYAAESDDATGYLVTPKVDALAAVAATASPAAVLIAGTSEGKEVAGRLAARLDSGLLVDAIDIDGDGTATQSVFGGAYTVHSKVSHGTPIVTVRPGALEAESADGAAESVSVDLPA